MSAPSLAIAPCFLAALAVAASLGATACASETGGSSGGSGDRHRGPPGGPVEGPADTHCGTSVQKTTAAACIDIGGNDLGGNDVDDGAGSGSGSGSTGSGADSGEASGYGDTLYNAEGDDDDCKYHVAFTSNDIYQDEDVTFTLAVTDKARQAAAEGASPSVEVFLNETHPAPNRGQASTDAADGTYDIGPVRFDAPGRWTVRFHLFESCTDLHEESPHGHVAFYMDVP